jgi:DNA-binding transcriptional LysR family regulator
LRHHVLLHLDEPLGPLPWLTWSTWLEAAGVPHLHAAGSMHFNHYEQVVRAAISGQGVALGRMPLLAHLVNDGSLAVLFADSAASNRCYWVITSRMARERAEVEWFVEWLMREAEANLDAARPNLEAKTTPSRPRRQDAKKSTKGA